MNKKVLTLCAGVLLSGLTCGTALAHTPEYRTPFVLSAPTNTPVNKIDTTKWYQLRTTSYKEGDVVLNGLLVQLRDPQTGKVYLKVMNEVNAPLLPSLWKIKYNAAGDGISGGHWTFVNKETNLELSYDHSFAATKTSGAVTKDNAVLEACNTTWEWFNTDVQGSNFGEVAPYSYIDADATKSTVMCMIQRQSDGLVYSYVGPKSEIIKNNVVNPSLNPLTIQPVLADAITLHAQDFNSMIDYNKTSMAQNGEFKFFYPNGNAMDSTRMSGFAAEAMKNGQKYQAVYGDISAIYDMALEQEGITEDVSTKREAVEEATSLLNDANKEYAALISEYQNIASEITTIDLQIKSYEKEIEQQKLTIKNESSEINKAATDLIKSFQVYETSYEEHCIIKDKNYTINRNNLVEAISSFEKESDAVKKAEYALNVITYSTSVFSAVSNNMDAAWSGFVAGVTETTERVKDECNQMHSDFSALENLMTNYEIQCSNYTLKNDLYKSKLEEATAAGKKYDDAMNTFIEAKKELATAIGNQHSYDRTKYILDEGYMQLHLVEDAGANVAAQNKYLMVDTTFYQNAQNPLGADLKIVNNTPKATDAAAISARYFFKLTYHPSQDSIVVEPLNASAISEKEFGKKWWRTSNAGNWFVWEDQSNYGSQPSNTFTRKKDGAVIEHPDGTKEVLPIVIKLNGDADTKGWALTTGSANKIGSELNTRIGFDNPYDYLTRVTLKEGLYFIKSKNTGKNIVANLKGNFQYDVEETGAQDYNNMPSTMFVVEKAGCKNGTRIKIHNREYGVMNVVPAFEGQLYKDKDGIYFIDKNYPTYLANRTLSIGDHYTITSVSNEEALTSDKHGYQYLNPEALPYTEYAIHYNLNANDNLYLNVDKADNFVKGSEGAVTYYELTTVNPINGSETVINAFGYGAGVVDENSGKKLKELTRQAYVLKVRDANLIDNDTTYVALVTENGQNEYYKAMGIKDIRAGKGQLAQFYLKADQLNDTTKYYALVDIRENTYMPIVNNGARIAKYTDANGYISHMDMDNQPSERVSAFALVKNDRPLYREVTDETINLFNNQNEKAVEDGMFLGFAKDNSKNGAMAVERLATDNARMPQYLLGFDKDSIADGYWCENNTHGYFATEDEAKAKDENHYVKYNGYTTGRYLVSFVDSVMGNEGSQAYNKDKVAKYTYKGVAVRLGFVEGVHMVITADEAKYINEFLGTEVAAGEYFFTLVGGHTLADLKNEQGYIIPEKLFSAEYTKMNTYTTGKHNSWSFSFRLIDEDPEMADKFLVESNLPGVSSIGSMEGAWIKDYENVPVVSYIDGNHSTIEASDLKKDNVTDGTIFTLEATDEEATANETIATGNVVVAGVNGAVVVKGAEGKNVIVSTILGKVVANEVLTSDNAQIAAPAGIVVVSVDGESFKVVVK